MPVLFLCPKEKQLSWLRQLRQNETSIWVYCKAQEEQQIWFHRKALIYIYTYTYIDIETIHNLAGSLTLWTEEKWNLQYKHTVLDPFEKHDSPVTLGIPCKRGTGSATMMPRLVPTSSKPWHTRRLVTDTRCCPAKCSKCPVTWEQWSLQGSKSLRANTISCTVSFGKESQRQISCQIVVLNFDSI